VKLTKGDLVFTNEGAGIILKFIQVAWGAKKYKVLIAGEVRYMWDKYFLVIDEGR
jgi:hypothetical protein